MELPNLIINYKAYNEALGERGLELSRIAKRVGEEFKKRIVVMPTFVDLRENAKIIDCYAQTLENIRGGAFTGHITINQILDSNAKGVVLNHSEKRMDFAEIEGVSKLAKENGLEVIVCCENWKEAERLNGIKEIDGIALEPRELIGSGRAVSKEKPEEIIKALEVVNKPLYIGAGIVTGEDVKIGKELGAFGILVASGIVKSKNKEEKIREFIEYL